MYAKLGSVKLEVTTEGSALTSKHDGGRMEIQKCHQLNRWWKDLDKTTKIKNETDQLLNDCDSSKTSVILKSSDCVSMKSLFKGMEPVLDLDLRMKNLSIVK